MSADLVAHETPHAPDSKCAREVDRSVNAHERRPRVASVIPQCAMVLGERPGRRNRDAEHRRVEDEARGGGNSTTVVRDDSAAPASAATFGP